MSSSPVVLLTGGNSQANITSTELFPAVPGCATPPLPATRTLHSTFLTEDRVATCGGRGNFNLVLADCLTLNPVSVQWQSDTSVLGHLPQKRSSAAEVTVAGVGTYLLGGWGKSHLSTSAFLPSGSATWQSGPDLPITISQACAFSYKQSIFITGGTSSTTNAPLRDMYEYSLVAKNWLPTSTWSGLQKGRYNHGCAVVGSTVVIVEGQDTSEYGTASTEIINLETKAKSLGEALQSPRLAQLATVGFGSQLRMLAFTYYSVKEWQEKSSTWVEVGKLVEQRNPIYMGSVAVPKGLVCKNEN